MTQKPLSFGHEDDLPQAVAASEGVPRPALLLSQDLFFTSKISGTASALGFRVEIEASRERALTKVGSGEYRCVFLDLAWKGIAVAELIANLPVAVPPPVIAFGAHVVTDRLDEARAAGCTEVLPRSKFSATLPELLVRYLGA